MREKAGSFLELCFSPDLAAEITLQPVRRFHTDAAILFSDILVIPHALGQQVSFVEGKGPRLDPLRRGSALATLSVDRVVERLTPVYEAVTRVAESLSVDTVLLGFAGAPWTVAAPP